MIRIELPDRPIPRGETIRGRVHILSESPYIAKEVKITLIRKEKYLHPSNFGTSFSTDSIENILFSAENMEITPPEKQIGFKITIPEHAPYTFESRLTRNQWQIQASVKSRLIPEVISQDFVVLPHVLKSKSFPNIDEVPLFVYKRDLEFMWGYRPFHIWRYTGLFHRSNHLNMSLDSSKYFPGDTVSGTIYFFEDFKDVNLRIFNVFLNKSKHAQSTEEEEHLVTYTHHTFDSGSNYRFSFSIPDTGFPTLETDNSRMWWIVRAVITRPFRFTKVMEQEIRVVPLII